MDSPSGFEVPHVVPSTEFHTHTVIALHGRGSQGPEFAEELFEGKTSSGLSLQEHFPTWKWVFPSAQERYSTVFQERMDEWFDIYSLTDPSKREDLQKGLRDSVTFLQGLIHEEAELVTLDRVILMGLSQGCATGLHTLLAGQCKLGAYIGLNGWMPFSAQIIEAMQSQSTSEEKTYLGSFYKSTFSMRAAIPVIEKQPLISLRIQSPAPAAAQSTINASISTTSSSMAQADLELKQVASLPVTHTPIFLGHTSDDEVIDVQLGRNSRAVLEEMGFKVSWKDHQEGGHLGFLETEGIDDIKTFLTNVLGLGDS